MVFLMLLSENFNNLFKPDRVIYPVRLKSILKVFGKGYGGEPFYRKVSPDKYI